MNTPEAHGILPGTPASALDTPCLLVDIERMERNIREWQPALGALGVNLRPHIKTHKVPAIARMQLDAGAVGITVAKVAEAEVFAAHGCGDIFIAYPVIGQEKWQRAARLAPICVLTVGVDSEIGARGLSTAAVEAGATIRVRIEVDIGLHRCGVSPDEAEALCRLVLGLPGLELDGLFAFRSIFFAGEVGQTAELGRDEGEQMALLASQLRFRGVPIHAVSVGSTPTARAAAQIPGITEVRPGTYIFGDLMMAEKGAVRYDDIALSILCTVISRPAPDKATIDGGSKTFSGDIMPASLGLRGYAKAVDLDAYVESLSEEHGVVRLGAGIDWEVGEKIAFYPIHVCTTVNLSDELIGIRDGKVEQVWTVLARGKRT